MAVHNMLVPNVFISLTMLPTYFRGHTLSVDHNSVMWAYVSTVERLTDWAKLNSREKGGGEWAMLHIHGMNVLYCNNNTRRAFGKLFPPTLNNCKTRLSTNTSHEENMFSVCWELSSGNCTRGHHR